MSEKNKRKKCQSWPYRGIYKQIAKEETAAMARNGVAGEVTVHAVRSSVLRGNPRLQARYNEILKERIAWTAKVNAEHERLREAV